MEILFITHKYPPSIGGMEKQSFELTTRMQAFAKVHLLCWDGKESKFRFFRLMKRRIGAILQEHPGISILHFNDGLAATFCSGAADFPQCKRSVTVHGLDIVFPSHWFQKRILPRFNHFDAVIAVSDATAQACIQRGISAEKVVVIPNGVDHEIAQYEPNEGEKNTFTQKYGHLFGAKGTLVMMGRPVKRKGFSWFLERIVPKIGPHVTILLIGPFHESRTLSDKFLYLLPPPIRKRLQLLFGMPSDENRLRQLLQNGGQIGTSTQTGTGIAHRDLLPGTAFGGNSVVHLGRLPFHDILQILSNATAFLMPNISVPGDMEGFGLVCLEANLRGLPVIASGIEGITAAVHHEKNGWLLPSENEKAWTDFLVTHLKNPETLKAKGQDAKEYALQTFGWQKMTEACFLLFSQLEKRE